MRFSRRLGVVLSSSILFMLNPIPLAAQEQRLWVGPNVNMVSGTTFPDGDPFLQRQNEPSVAVSTRNPLHLLAGANDYRAVDIPGLPEGKETGDSWLGVFYSLDGGSSWKSSLLPGYPQDTTQFGTSSPLYGYDAGADPVVRAGTDGLFYYAGIAFIRENLAESAIFVARFEDRNDTESGNPIIHHDTRIVTAASGTLFVDKPWLAVDIPRGGAQCGNVYVAWAEIDSSGASPTSNIMFSRSTDCGINWDAPIQLSADGTLPQGATIAVAPTTGDVHVAWRQHTSLSLVPTDCFHIAGHWKNHPDDWPVQSITMGGVQYSKNQALDILNTPARGDATYILAYQLIPAKLNFEINNVSAEIQAVIDAADAWLMDNPINSKPSGAAKDEGLALKDQLEAFNTDDGLDGLLGPGVCATEVLNPSDAIVAVASTDGGASFDGPIPVADVHPFDQGTSAYSFRSNSYPTMTVDETGRVYLAWTTRGLAAGNANPLEDGGDARIVVATSPDGLTWNPPQAIDQPGEPGHQIKPSLTYTGKLLLTYYDFREDVSEIFDRFVADFPSETPLPRHTVDVRAAVAEPGDAPVFTDYTSLLDLERPSTQLSRYPFVITGTSAIDAEAVQLQYNPPNLPMFKGGTVPFFSDYLDSASAPPFVWDFYDAWVYNIDPHASPVAHVVWTDNRDVVGPPDGNWASYIPPAHANSGGTSIFDPNQAVPECQPGSEDEQRTRMRNQNVYTARLTEGLFVGVPGNSRPLGSIQGIPDLMQRAFVVFVQNTTSEERSFELTILDQPENGDASFEQFEFSETAEVTIGPYSSASRTVFVSSDVEGPPWPSVEIDVTETWPADPEPLHSTVRINADPNNPPPADTSLADGEIYNPSIWNPSIWNPSIWNPDIENPSIWNPSIWNPSIWNPSIWNPSIWNPSIWNPSIWNPSIVNPSIWNPSIWNPSIWNPSIWNPSIWNPSIWNPSIWNTNVMNPSIWNPSIWNPSIWNSALGEATDVTWTVRNDGNATAAYSFNLLADQVPSDFAFQLMVYRVYTTPVAEGCELTEEGQQETLVNIVDPDFSSPDLLDPNTSDPDVATFYLEPGEEVFITLRVYDPDGTDDVVFYPETVQPAVVAQGVNTADALAGETQQPYAIPDISVPTTTALNDSRANHTSTVLPDGTILIAGGFNGTDGVLSSAEVYDPVTRTFTPVDGGMNAPRFFHTATLLDDGTVLLVGGSSGDPGPGAEIYDPDEGTFTPIDDPNVIRNGHRATRLPDGRVLITGGNEGLTAVSSAEVYDPSTGDFTLVGSMGAARWAHSATLLTTGEVLVAGGYGGGATDLDTAELFDPTTDTFSPVPGAMSDPRRFHSATLLPDGTVLLAGGLFDSSLVANASADIYDRATNSLSPTGSLFVGRASHTATLMADGTVLLAGGWSLISGTPEIFSHIEAYDWSTGTFTEKGQLTIPRVEHTATRLPDGKALITGGTTYSNPMTEGTTSSELYVPAEKAKFKKIGDMATPRLYHTVTTLLGGDVIIVGGLDEDSNGIATIERFSPATGEITTVATMPEARMFHSATLLDDGTVLIAGGSPDDGVNVLDTALIYDPSDDSLVTTGPLQTARYAHAAVRLADGRVLLAAGTSTGDLPLSNTEIYDPATGTFSPSDSLATARATGGASVLLDDGRVLIAGGRTNWAGVTDAFQVWDPATETFGSEGAMNEPRRSHRSTLLHDGTVLVAGGRSDIGWLDSAEVFDPDTGIFTATAGTMRLARGSQAQVLLPSGEVLLAGGIKPGGILLSYAEIYDPVTQTFRLTDALTGHNSGTRPTSLADGRVLIVGGMSFYGPMGLVPTTAVEVYNPWDLTGSGKAAFTAQPKDVPIGGLVSPRVQVAVFDRSFTPIPSAQVSLRLENAFGGAGTTWEAWTNGNGVATFDDVWFDRLGPGRRLIAEATTPDGLLSTDPSVPFEVLPLVVTNTHDDGPGSLRRAIENANRNAGYHDTISFDIVGAGLHQIDLAGELPTLSDPVSIDGSTQAGYADTPLIRIDGSSLPPDGVAIRGGGDDIELRALMITGAPGWGVRSVAASSLTIEDCFVGTDGSSPLGNRVGLEIREGSGHLLTGNVVSGNEWDGIILVGVSNSTVSTNAIGTDPSGSSDLGNGKVGGGSGLVIDNSHNNTISDNIISGSSYHGIDLKSGSTFNTIVGNTIGLNAARDATIPNEQNGIHARWSVANNTIGGINDGDGNVIAGNGVNGIIVEDAVGPHTIQGNWVGTNPSYGTGLGNGERGISIRYSDDTVIGGADAAAGNVSMWNVTSGIQIYGSTGTYVEGNHIAGNGGTGIIIDAGSTLTTVVDNFIGTDATGTLPVGNTLSGVYLLDSSGNTIGGPGGRNIIAANRRGVFVTGNDNTIENNYIGTDVTGSIDLGNDEDGAWILGYNNVILGNLVSGNGRDGVSLAYGAGLNRVEDNRIGTAADGTSPLPNDGSGVKVDWDSPDNQIRNNTIAHNGSAGVEVISGTGNTIDSNSIFSNTRLGIDLGGDGVTPNDVLDADGGPNSLLNFPILTYSRSTSTSARVEGSIDIAAEERALIDLYLNDPVLTDACDGSGYGEGGQHLTQFELISRMDDLVFVAPDLEWGANLFYYVYHDENDYSRFGTVTPTGVITERYGIGAHVPAMTFVASNVPGWGANKFYFLRDDLAGGYTFMWMTTEVMGEIATVGGGFHSLTYASPDLGYGADLFYYLRRDGAGVSWFGTLTPAGVATDRIALGTGFDDITFVAANVGYGLTNHFYYVRHDVTGFSTFGTLSPAGTVIDRFGVGFDSVAIAHDAADLGYGVNQFYRLSKHQGDEDLSTFSTTDLSGSNTIRFMVAPFTRYFPTASDLSGKFISATATTGSGSNLETSEFSACIAVAP